MRLFVLLAGLAASLALVGGASAAQLIDRNATGVRIRANAEGEALLTYRAHGMSRHVLLWGAINARPTVPGTKQVKLHVDYSGGWHTRRTLYWQHFPGSCGRYDGPPLPNLVVACKAPDGSYWAAQSWAQPLPDLGFEPWLPELRAKWLDVSHWSGPTAQLETGMDWVYSGRFQDLFGRYTYRGSPVWGLHTTRYGAPTDSFGRLVYLDTFDSVYGPGWHRENSFVPHGHTGVFCYGFYAFDPTEGGYRHPPGWTERRGPGTGTKYRIFAEGPGVTPDVSVVVPGSHAFDRSSPEDVALQGEESARLASWGDRKCRAGH